MPGRGKPFAFAAPLVLLGLAVVFVTLFFAKRVPRTPATSGNDPRLAQIEILVQAADAAELIGDWTAARKALDAASALAPENPDLRKRRDDMAAEEKREKLVKEAEEARARGDAAAEAAAIAEARRIREEDELKARQGVLQAKGLADRAAEAEKAGDLIGAEQLFRESLKVHDDAEVQKLLVAVQKRIEDERLLAARKGAEAAAAEGILACDEGRVETARERLGVALAAEDRPAWREKLREVEERAQMCEKQLAAATQAVEKGEYRAALTAAELAARFNVESKPAHALINQLRSRAVRAGMVKVEACRVQVGENPMQVGTFYMDEREVTEAQWAAYLSANRLRAPRSWAGGKPSGDGTLPVMGISALEAEAYAEWAGKRLPTEAEWLAAAGAADGREYPWGAGWDASKANAKSEGPRAVGSYAAGASPSGARDMAGNVAEWTGTKEGAMRVVKGGSFLFPESACRLGWRWLEHEDLGFAGIGFRCAADGE